MSEYWRARIIARPPTPDAIRAELDAAWARLERAERVFDATRGRPGGGPAWQAREDARARVAQLDLELLDAEGVGS